ncbi:MAG: hypothetical protein PHQ36_05855 [Anaerolineales bacterium]|nr:hypothetical protein [Anaerolineales bacterium]
MNRKKDNPVTKAKTVSLNIQIDRGKLTLGDLRFMSSMAGKSGKNKISPESMDRMFALLDRAVIGGIDNIPLDAMPQLMDAFGEAISAETEIKN